MDTGSHLLFGVTLAGLAFFHPDVAAQPHLAAAVLSVTLVGSHAPDLDSVVRIKGQDAYLKHHRGLSHSFPAWLVWSALIGGLAAWGWGFSEHLLLLCSFAFAAVALHVIFDWTNAYGVQCLLPFRREWYHLDALCLTDPFLGVVHASAAIGAIIGLWPYPQWICAGAWGLTIVYIIWRVVHHEVVVKRVRRRYRRWRAIHVLPGLWWFKWQYVVQTDTGFEMGVIDGRRLLPSRHLPFSEPHHCIEATRNVSAVRTLQDFAKREYVSWTVEPGGGYLVTWTDLRFWREKDWPYRAEVRLDDHYNVIGEQIGWYKKAWEAPYV
ncbi:metal-dependent hydrolase [Cohnella silvisoli]|uniref:Metal-dependent hydrolase n=1 Tax=Cohnella silvisoli TaxID=2873699 RepID=A0ABV1KNM4_9BACL|nr:metal-dependent hydrolase [Cohnella silvisoli]MCD9021001.1 metal-dependent hydrolase [Cohnella silvisoli]